MPTKFQIATLLHLFPDRLRKSVHVVLPVNNLNANTHVQSTAPPTSIWLNVPAPFRPSSSFRQPAQQGPWTTRTQYHQSSAWRPAFHRCLSWPAARYLGPDSGHGRPSALRPAPSTPAPRTYVWVRGAAAPRWELLLGHQQLLYSERSGLGVSVPSRGCTGPRPHASRSRAPFVCSYRRKNNKLSAICFNPNCKSARSCKAAKAFIARRDSRERAAKRARNEREINSFD
jgi:hypothetical protein